MQCPCIVVIYEWLSSYEKKNLFFLWVFIIESWIGVGIWSCDKLSYKSLYEARQTIKARYEKGYIIPMYVLCFYYIAHSNIIILSSEKRSLGEYNDQQFILILRFVYFCHCILI